MLLVAYASALLMSIAWEVNSSGTSPCDKALSRAMEKSLDRGLEALQKVERKCPDHVPTLLALGRYLTHQREKASPNWTSMALEYWERAHRLDRAGWIPRWEAALLLEYVGEYERAASYYQLTLETPALAEAPDAKMIYDALRSEAKAHLVTCRFLLGLGRGAAEQGPRSSGSPPEHSPASTVTDFTDESIRKRARWDALQEFVAAVGIASAAGLGADSQLVQAALASVQDWRNAPTAARIEARNRLVAGIVATFVSAVVERSLTGKVNGFLADHRGWTIPAWPTGDDFSPQMEKEFRDAKPDEGRRFEISESLTIVERWEIPNLAGRWTCRQLTSTRNGEPQPIPYPVSQLQLEQSGSTLVGTWANESPYARPTRTTYEIQGQRLIETSCTNSGYNCHRAGTTVSNECVIETSNRIRFRGVLHDNEFGHTYEGEGTCERVQ